MGASRCCPGNRRFAARFLLPAALAFLSACGTKQFNVQQVPSEPFKGFGQFEITPFAVELPADAEPERRAEANEFALAIRNRLAARLKGSERFAGQGRTLVIKGNIVGFDPGSQMARYFVGFGAGSGEIVADVTLANEAGDPVAKGAAVGGVSMGLFGGNISSAARRLADASYGFILDNYETVEARPAGSQP